MIFRILLPVLGIIEYLENKSMRVRRIHKCHDEINISQRATFFLLIRLLLSAVYTHIHTYVRRRGDPFLVPLRVRGAQCLRARYYIDDLSGLYYVEYNVSKCILLLARSACTLRLPRFRLSFRISLLISAGPLIAHASL